MGWPRLTGWLSELSGTSLPPLRLSFVPRSPVAPDPGLGWKGRRKRGRRAQAAGTGREGQVLACRGRMAAETGSKPQEPGMDSFPPALFPSPLIFTGQVPTSHHTHLEATHPASSPSAPHFLLSFLSWAKKAVGMPKPRVGEGAGGDGSEHLPQLHQARTSPLPQSYNIHEPHEYAILSLWGGGLTLSAFLLPLPKITRRSRS